MQSTSITVVIASNTYVLRSSDPRSMRDIPREHREQLISCLEQLKQQHDRSLQAVDGALATGPANAGPRSADSRPQDRLGTGDIDDLMARLALEEKQTRKATLTPATIYKITAVLVLVILALSFF